MAANLQGKFDINIYGCSRVDKLQLNSEGNRVESLVYTDKEGIKTIDDLDACVLALGSKGMKGLLQNSPQLAKVAHVFLLLVCN